jgi:hypothetical protein
MRYIKHLIECQCTLRIYKNRSKNIFHKFPVFTFLDESGSVKEKYVLCNNCDILHKVTEVNKSEIKWGSEGLKSLVATKEDIKFNFASQGLNELINILEVNLIDISEWEYIDYLFENNIEGQVVLEKKEIDDNINLKLLLIKNNKYRIKNELVQRFL